MFLCFIHVLPLIQDDLTENKEKLSKLEGREEERKIKEEEIRKMKKDMGIKEEEIKNLKVNWIRISFKQIQIAYYKYSLS